MNTTNTAMRLLIMGANGGIGKQLVIMALDKGYTVTAVLRNPDKLDIHHTHLKIIKGDVLKPETLKSAMADQDVVISALGINTRKATITYSQGSANLLNLMKETGVKRCFFISASGLEVNPSFNFFFQWATKNILQRILKEMYKDLERMEAIVKQSDLNWTIMRPPRLTNAEARFVYRFAINRYLEHGMQISRADLAHYILTNLENHSIFKATVEVAY